MSKWKVDCVRVRVCAREKREKGGKKRKSLVLHSSPRLVYRSWDLEWGLRRLRDLTHARTLVTLFPYLSKRAISLPFMCAFTHPPPHSCSLYCWVLLVDSFNRLWRQNDSLRAALQNTVHASPGIVGLESNVFQRWNRWLGAALTSPQVSIPPWSVFWFDKAS